LGGYRQPEDAVGLAAAWVDTADRKMRSDYARWFGLVSEHEKKLFNRYQIDSVDIATNADYVKGLMTFFANR